MFGFAFFMKYNMHTYMCVHMYTYEYMFKVPAMRNDNISQ